MTESASTPPPGPTSSFVGVSTATMVKGVLACLIGLALLYWGHHGGHGPIAMGPGFVQFFGLIVALYGVATLTASTWTRSRLKLTKQERAEWGPALFPRKGELLDRMAAGEAVGALADDLERTSQVPRHVTLRYIIEIGRQVADDIDR